VTGGPLDGVTVVSLEQAVSAPYATRQLADLGARVVKVERPDGGDFARHFDTAANGTGAHFAWVNRNKESLTLDVKAPGGAAVLDRLLDRADVLVHNLVPGAAPRLGLDGATLVANRPAIDALVREVVGALDADAAVALLHGAGIGCAVVRSIAEVVEHPQLTARDRWLSVPAPAGPVWTPLAPPVTSAWSTPAGAVPGLGEHTDAILAELGYDPAGISRLHDDGAV
jgi:crotonobetainyl-CoA:carnitine CoA-transferase CaiB-like acyl-CoA transferase